MTTPVITAYRNLLDIAANSIRDYTVADLANALKGDIRLPGTVAGTGMDISRDFAVTLPDSRTFDLSAVLSVVRLINKGTTPSLFVRVTLAWEGPQGTHAALAALQLTDETAQYLADHGAALPRPIKPGQDVMAWLLSADPAEAAAKRYKAIWDHVVPNYGLDYKLHEEVVNAAKAIEPQLLAMLFDAEGALDGVLELGGMTGIVDPDHLVGINDWLTRHLTPAV